MAKLETIQDLIDASETERSQRKIDIRGQVVSEVEDSEFQFH